LSSLKTSLSGAVFQTTMQCLHRFHSCEKIHYPSWKRRQTTFFFVRQSSDRRHSCTPDKATQQSSAIAIDARGATPPRTYSSSASAPLAPKLIAVHEFSSVSLYVNMVFWFCSLNNAFENSKKRRVLLRALYHRRNESREAKLCRRPHIK
jgi:hypothetical protein